MPHTLLRNDSENDMTFLAHPEQCLCFTGNRPEKFETGTILPPAVVTETVRTLLMMLIADTITKQPHYQYFITGMARGVDCWAGESLLYLKLMEHLPIHLIAAFANPSQAVITSEKSGAPNPRATILHELTAEADAVICCCEGNQSWTFLRRNDYMIQHASLLLGAYHKMDGGTAYTVKKARHERLPIRSIDCRDVQKLFILLERYPEICQLHTQQARFQFWEKHPHLLYQCGLLTEEQPPEQPEQLSLPLE